MCDNIYLYVQLLLASEFTVTAIISSIQFQHYALYKDAVVKSIIQEIFSSIHCSVLCKCAI